MYKAVSLRTTGYAQERRVWDEANVQKPRTPCFGQGSASPEAGAFPLGIGESEYIENGLKTKGKGAKRLPWTWLSCLSLELSWKWDLTPLSDSRASPTMVQAGGGFTTALEDQDPVWPLWPQVSDGEGKMRQTVKINWVSRSHFLKCYRT